MGSGDDRYPEDNGRKGWRRWLTRFRFRRRASSEQPVPRETASAIAVTQTTEAPLPKDTRPSKSVEHHPGQKLTDNSSISTNVSSKTSARRQKKVADESRKRSNPKPSRESLPRPSGRNSRESVQKTQELDPVTELNRSRQHRRRTMSADSRKNKKRQSREKPDDLDASISQSFRRSFKSFKNRAKDIRSVKTFMSRSVKPQDMQRAVARVEARQQKRSEHSTGEELATKKSARLHRGDDQYPQRRSGSARSSTARKRDPTQSDRFEPMSLPPNRAHRKASAETITLIEDNNNNDGELFGKDGRPFWQQKIKGKADEDDSDVTDDELPLNGEALLAVNTGKTKLVDMPLETITLDPYGVVKEMENRDNTFFYRDLIFSNTVRSMINLSDDLYSETSRKPPVTRYCHFVEPNAITRYQRSDAEKHVTDKFTPQHPVRK